MRDAVRVKVILTGPLLAASFSLAALGCAANPGVELELSDGEGTAENGASVTVQVSLTQRPLGAVYVRAISDDETEGRVSPAVRFGPNDWQLPQTITITGVDDDVADGDVTFHVRFEESNGFQPRSAPVELDELTLLNRDDERARFIALDGMTLANGVSANGGLVVGSTPNQACRWTSELGFELLPGDKAAALGVSPNGELTTGWKAQSDAVNGSIAVVWTGTGDPQPVQQTTPSDQFDFYAGRRVLDDGTVFGSCTQRGINRLGCRWDAEHGLDDMGGSVVNAADETGAYAGAVVPDPRSRDPRARALLNGELLSFPADTICLQPLYCQTELQAFSADHSIAVGIASLPEPGQGPVPTPRLWNYAIVYTLEQQMQRLDDLPGGEQGAGAYAISADGRIIVGFGTDTTGRRATIWIDRKPQSLAEFLQNAGADVPSGWQLSTLSALSADGRVLIGNGIDPDGNPHAFRIELPTAS